MNDYLDITASKLLKELDHFFLIDTHDGAQTGFWVNEQALMDRHYWIDGDYKVEIVRALQPAHQHAPHNYKITPAWPHSKMTVMWCCWNMMVSIKKY